MPSRIAIDPLDTEPEPTHVVGVGASAGGLEAIERMFKKLPADSGMAFVLVQHLSPDFKSLMDELLARWTTMPIHRVEDRMLVQGNHIYLIPPKMEISIDGLELRLVDKKTDEGLSLPINVFLRSLAKEWQSRSVAVILSGTGSDGALGIRDIHEVGGLVISQSAESAKFDGMPKSAVRTGVVDLILSPEDIADTLQRYAAFPLGDKARLLDDQPMVVDQSSMGRLLRLLQNESGIDFSLYRTSTVTRRVERRVLLCQAADFDDYVDQAAQDQSELDSLYKDLLIGVTQFFRDPAAFERLARDVFPSLIEQLEPGQQFRAWVAGCATGEEAYSIAILLSELMEDLNVRCDVKIFATDVHRTSLEVASNAVYREACLSEVSAERRRRFFVATPNGYQLKTEIRQMIVFAPHNLITDAPFTKLNFVSCRNLLIYFEPSLQERVLGLFHFALNKNGALFLGPSESLGELTNEFSTIDGHWKLYRKKREIRLTRHLAVTGLTDPTSTKNAFGDQGIDANKSSSLLTDRMLLAAYDRLLETYMPDGVLINQQRELVHVFGNAVNYVRLRPGRPTSDALNLMPPPLRAAAAAAINRASRENETVHLSGLRLNGDPDAPTIRLGVQPIHAKDGDVTHFMLTFAPADLSVDLPSTELHPSSLSSDKMFVLENELRVMRENLQITVEELETSSEELQATNEELVASNEELQSTNEELHSVNEELYTVNGEYQKKIAELTELTDDLNHLFHNLDVGLLFLDSELRVRKFTPSVAAVFSLMPQDIGRNFESFSHQLIRPQLADDIRAVLESKRPFEKELRSKQGEWYLVQIQPYRSRGTVDGAVIELFEITHIKRSRSQLQRSIARLQSALSITAMPIAVKDVQGRYVYVSDAFANQLGDRADELIDKLDEDLFLSDDAKRLAAASNEAIATGLVAEVTQLQIRDVNEMISAQIHPLRNHAEKVDSVVLQLGISE